MRILHLIILWLFALSAMGAAIPFFATGDSKTAGSGSVGEWSDNCGSGYTNLPALYAFGGYTSGALLADYQAGLINDRTTPTPKYVALNVGANDISTSWNTTTVFQNLTNMVNYLTNKWPGVKVGIARIWLRNDASDVVAFNGVVTNVVQAYAGTCFYGPNEAVWLENGDNGTTYTSDGTHYSDPAGLLECGNQWEAVFDAQESGVSVFYVDSAATGAMNGTSWTDAWTNVTDITGVTGGATVYISGGPSGQHRVYFPRYESSTLWIPASGTASNRITYKIGQDTNHNGTAWFSGDGSQGWLGYNGAPHDINISGDAGDGLMHFALTNYTSGGSLDYWSDFRISYVNLGERGGFGNGGVCTNFQIDHTWTKSTNLTGYETHRLKTPAGSAIGSSSYHHNVSYNPQMVTGFGDDNVIAAGDGIDFYENYFIGYTQTNGSCFQHPDGLFTGGFSNVRIWNNTFIDIADYAVYSAIDNGGEGTTNTYRSHDIYVWNNLFVNCLASVAIGTDYSGKYSWYSNVFVFNNTADNGTWPSMQNMSIGGGYNGTNTLVTNTYFANNLSIGGDSTNTGGLQIYAIAAAGTYTNANILISPAQAASLLTSYTTTNSNTRASTNSNLMPLLTASAIVGQGTNLNSFFTTDLLGTTRGATWDIGAYEGAGSPTPEPPAAGRVERVWSGTVRAGR